MRREESVPLDIGEDGRKAWQALKDSFVKVPILVHFERDRLTRVELDASNGGIGAILSQLVPNPPKTSQWRPVGFYSRKLIAAEYNYDTHDKELLAMVKGLQHWRHYLDGIHFEVHTDHRNLQWFMETKTLNHRQVRSYLFLSQFDFTITHKPGSTNPADAPSRRPDYMEAVDAPEQRTNQTFVEPLRNLLGRRTKSSDSALVSAVTRQAVPKSQDLSRRKAIHRFRREDVLNNT